MGQPSFATTHGVLSPVISFALTSTFRVCTRSSSSNTTAADSSTSTLQRIRLRSGRGSNCERLWDTRSDTSLLHDRDAIFSAELDESIRRLGLRVLKSPPRSPKANSICERVIGTIRRECLDWIIPLSEAHLRQTLRTWVAHYNRGRPHSALGPGVPDPPANSTVTFSPFRHRLGDFRSVRAKAILGGLHHEYSLARA